MNNLYFFHALDDTTSFLKVFQENFKENYFIIEANSNSLSEVLKKIQAIPNDGTIIFLGHGNSSGLYSPETKSFSKEIFVDLETGNDIFHDKKVILLSCRSNEYINRLTNYKSIIGFGNILSSIEEVRIEAEIETGRFRNISESDINFFNQSYCNAIIKTLRKYSIGIMKFTEIPEFVEYYINKVINKVLLDKTIENRIEVARLLFQFRNEISIKNNIY